MKFMQSEHSENGTGRSGCPRRFELLRASVGDLEPAECDAVRDHVAGCSACRDIWESFDRQRTEFLEKHPPGPVIARISAEVARRLGRRRLLTKLVPLAAAAVVSVAALMFTGDRPSGIRTKGPPVSLYFYVLKDGRGKPGISGEVYRENDRIQFVYTSNAFRYLFLISLDDIGRVSNFNYQASPTSVPIATGLNKVLEGSIILDDSPYPERVFGVFTNQPLDLATVERAARDSWDELRKINGSVKDLEELPLDHPQATVFFLKE